MGGRLAVGRVRVRERMDVGAGVGFRGASRRGKGGAAGMAVAAAVAAATTAAPHRQAASASASRQAQPSLPPPATRGHLCGNPAAQCAGTARSGGSSLSAMDACPVKVRQPGVTRGAEPLRKGRGGNQPPMVKSGCRGLRQQGAATNRRGESLGKRTRGQPIRLPSPCAQAHTWPRPAPCRPPPHLH